ncbi:hypothetical protein [Aquimarina sediminis]|uniref:hypothetical protein n=1 Tax=Aquimarina sediminis TaxID=2070536 RepID=UPI000FFEFFFA|nr:hypothetical protein [Aquimarina sediminis]
MGAVFACTAPFIHVLYPKKSPQFKVLKQQLDDGKITQETYASKYKTLQKSKRFIGFTNIRKFWYAIGKPISMLYFALLLIYVYPFIIIDKKVKRIVGGSIILFLFISMYFIVWTLWHRQDFPKELYYWAIGIVSIIGSMISIFIINYNKDKTMLMNLHSLMRFIVNDVKHKYVAEEDKARFVEDYMDEIEKLKG